MSKSITHSLDSLERHFKFENTRTRFEVVAGLTAGGIALTMLCLFVLSALNQKVHISDAAATKIQHYTLHFGLLTLGFASIATHYASKTRRNAAQKLKEVDQAKKRVQQLNNEPVKPEESPPVERLAPSKTRLDAKKVDICVAVAVALMCLTQIALIVIYHKAPKIDALIFTKLAQISHLKISAGLIFMLAFTGSFLWLIQRIAASIDRDTGSYNFNVKEYENADIQDLNKSKEAK